MAGIYIHIPFCKQACHYCNFHFSTSLQSKNEMIDALLSELEDKKESIQHQLVHTIYFGGVPLALLDSHDIDRLLSSIHQHYKVNALAELTLEANPDDITLEKLHTYKAMGINRFSLGVQSFFDEDLIYMHRTHHAKQAEQSIIWLHQAGFHNISVDLIFGFPLLRHDKLQLNIDKLLHYAIPHISTYAMTVEPHTALASFIKQQKESPMDTTQSATQYEYIMERLGNEKYEHYEISSFAKNGFRSKHNSAYWNQEHYIGIGPSAHSYFGHTRQWNLANNTKYIKAIKNKHVYYESELLSFEDRLNEYLMIQLRKSEGVDLSYVEEHFKLRLEHMYQKEMDEYIEKGYLQKKDSFLVLTNKGKLFADAIASSLFLTKD
ncbi:MAG: radical SAM family heme chaperone HemW [Chitinophagaceae bacterium]